MFGERERENELHETSFGLALVASPTVSVHSHSYGLLWRLSTRERERELIAYFAEQCSLLFDGYDDPDALFNNVVLSLRGF